MGNKKRCPRCKKLKALEAFPTDPSKASGRSSYCNPCNNARRRDWYANNKEKAKASNCEKRTEWLGVTYEKPITRNTAANRQIRAEVLALLGGACACCGESKHEFLTVDHVNGGGNKHRMANTNGYFYRVLRKDIEAGNRERYRVLCYNCNCAIGHRGYCPHSKQPG